MESNNNLLWLIYLSKIELLRGKTEHWWNVLAACSKVKKNSNGFWAEAINTIVYLKNRSPTKKLELKTPFEIFYGYKPEISHLRIFGCRAFAYIPKDDRRKLDAKSIECVFVGYYDYQKAYRLFHPSSHKLIASRDVVFHENRDISNMMNNADEEQMPDENVKIDKIVQKVQE